MAKAVLSALLSAMTPATLPSIVMSGLPLEPRSIGIASWMSRRPSTSVD
jgi:hypothetical protein